MIPIQPASTVLVVRESTTRKVEVLLLKRSSKLAFAANSWVFPGGRIDPADGSIEVNQIKGTAQIAAVREAHEEAGIRMSPDRLTQFCHWTTPVGGSRRFSTWFFHTLLPDDHDTVQIDNSEIVDYRWITPLDALEAMTAKELFLLPPTFLNLARITKATNYKEVSDEFQRTGIINAAPVTDKVDGTFYSMYKGDAGYDNGDITMTSSLHRLVMNPHHGNYKFLYQNCTEPPVNGLGHRHF